MMGPSNQMAPGAERPEHPAMSSRPPPHGTKFSFATGMDSDELGQYYPPQHQPYAPYPEHAHTPPEYAHELEGVLPAGADYDYLGLGYEVPEWYEQQQQQQHK